MSEQSLTVRPNSNDALLWFTTLAVTVLASAVFQSLPGIDKAVSALFFTPATGFPAQDNEALVALRWAGLLVGRIATTVLIGILILKLVAPQFVSGIETRVFLYLATSYAAGPGLIVNALLKSYWGRPRPVQSDVFGGPMSFMPAWEPGGACGSNCSFVSGEASSSFWVVALAFLVPARWRPFAFAAAGLWTFVISLNRIAFGGHFLSDVILAWCLTFLVVLGAREVFLIRMDRAQSLRIDDAISRLRNRILSALHR